MAKPKRADVQEIASARRDYDIFAGWLDVLVNPDIIFRENPQRGIRIYRDMARDGHIRSVMQTRKLAVINKEWEIVSASDDAADVRVRDEVADILGKVKRFERARLDLLDGLLSGFAVGEIMWEVVGGRVVPVEIRRRGQHRFVFDFDGRLRLLTMQNMANGEELPDRKFLLFQYDADPENPYGVGLGQSCYWPWWFKKHATKFALVGLERYGMPFPLGKYPSNAQHMKDDLLATLESIQTDSAAVIPAGFEVELLESKRTAATDAYSPFVDRMNDEISKAVLGQTATVTGTPGKLGEEKERGEVRDDYVAADSDLLDEVISSQLIRWIVDFNFGADVPAPAFHTTLESELTIDEEATLATRDEALVRQGVRIPMRHYYETYQIEEPKDGEEVAERAGPASGFAPGDVAAAFRTADRARGVK
jgi:phage gp29-like protein